MICPYCGADKSRCIDSRPLGPDRWRRHLCLACDQRFNSRERVIEGRDLVKEKARRIKAAKQAAEVLRQDILDALESVNTVLETLEEGEKDA